MDIITQRLIAFRKKIITEFRRLSDSIKQHEEAKRESENSKKEQYSPPAMVGILHAVQSVAKSQRTAHDPKKWYKDRTFLVSVAGVIAVVAYTTVTAFQWCELRGQVDAYIKGQRAQVVIENFNPNSDYSVDNPNPGTFQVVNRGNSAATNVYIRPDSKIGKEWITGKGGFSTEQWAVLSRSIQELRAECGKPEPTPARGIYRFSLGREDTHREAAIERPTDPAILKDIVGQANYVVACYTDAFGEVRSSFDCIYWRPGGINGGSFWPCRVRLEQ